MNSLRLPARRHVSAWPPVCLLASCLWLAAPAWADNGSTASTPTGTAPTSGGAAGVSTGSSELPKERVLGIGGFFFRSKDPKALRKWYAANLGITPPIKDYWMETAGPTVFQAFPAKTDYFGSLEKQWMIDFRVANMDAIVRQLRAANIEVTVDPTVYPNGRFARLYDPEGNAIELWEPKDPSSVGAQTTNSATSK